MEDNYWKIRDKCVNELDTENTMRLVLDLLGNLKDLEEEKEKAEEKIKALVEDYNEEKEIFEREGNARVDNLKSQLIKEKALGEHADQEKISALEEMIAFEQEGLADALDDKEEKHDEEVSAITEALEKKLEKIREELDAEKSRVRRCTSQKKRSIRRGRSSG